MFRSRGLVALSFFILLLSCGGQEQQTLGLFFDAVQSGDETARATVSAVEMPVKVQSWEIIEIGEQSTAPFALPELLKKARNAKRETDYHAEKMGIFIDDNRATHERYKNQMNHDPDAELKGDLVEHHEKWEELIQEEKELAAAMKQANRDMELERNAAGISLMGAAVNENLDGDVATNEVLVNVDTGTGEKRYRFTLKNYSLFNTKNQIQQRSRWTITDIQEQG